MSAAPAPRLVPQPQPTVLRTSIGLALSLLPQLAFGQAASPPSDEPDSDDVARAKQKTVQELDAVDVRGVREQLSSPKFTAPLVDTAQSVTILDHDLLQSTAANSLLDALRNVPGITFGAGEGGNPVADRPSIRGFNSSANTYLDGMRDIGAQSRDIFNTEQVEVIRGPDSSIAGRSSGGGSINLVSKTPSLGDSLAASATYGSADQYRATADGNLTLGDATAARVSVMRMGGGVPGRDDAVRTDKFGIAPAITFGLDTATRVTLGYYHLRDQGTPDFGVPIDTRTGTPITETCGVRRENFYGLVDRDFRDNRVDTLTATLEHDFGDALRLRSQVRGGRNVNDYIVTNPDDYAGNTRNDLVYRLPLARRAKDDTLIGQTDLSGHFEAGGLRHDFDVGVELSQEKLRRAGDGNYNGYIVTAPNGDGPFDSEDCSVPGTAEYARKQASEQCTGLYDPDPRAPWLGTITVNPSSTRYATRNAAAYAFDTITFGPRWKANAGVRFDDYRTRTRNEDGTLRDDQTFVSYQASLIYKPHPAGSVYLASSTASIPESLAIADQDQAQGGTPYSASTIGADPEQTRSIELGTKWKLFDERLLLSADVFDETRRNASVEVEPGLFAQVGRTRVRGAEISANGSITEAWNLTAGYSYLDGVLEKGSLGDPAVGRPLVDTPRDTFSLWTTYRVSPSITVGGGAYYRDRQVGYYGPPDRVIDDYWRVDALAQWQVTPRVGLQLNVQNVFDEDYYGKVYYHYAIPAAGRTWLLTANFKL